MTDLLTSLPRFDARPFSNLLPSLEKHQITLTDLLTADTSDLAKRAQLPVRQLHALVDAILTGLHRQLGLISDGHSDVHDRSSDEPQLQTSGTKLVSQWQTISLLDETFDVTLGGGIPTRYLTEVTGESGVGKTQFLLTLLLAVQLPPPHGLSRSALYISTEAPLPTSRLSQLLSTHPLLASRPISDKPSLSKILTLQTPDLESQDHILRYQLPVAVRRHNVGLVIIDSITANFRAEFDRPDLRSGSHSTTSTARSGPAAMARRSEQLVELGAMLRDLARTANIAIVVANQVADRFRTEPSTVNTAQGAGWSQPDGYVPRPSELVIEQMHSPAMPPASEPPRNAMSATSNLSINNPMTLDHQQRWFTGWGASQTHQTTSFGRSDTNLKTPSLGLVWTNQIACRIALIKTPRSGRLAEGEESRRWRRHIKVVFAPWAKGEDGGNGIEFIIEGNGIKALAASKAI